MVPNFLSAGASNPNALPILTGWEPFQYERQVLKERASDGATRSRIVLKGVLQRADTLNQNGRVYPKAILEREVRNYQKFIRERRSLGECDHPEASVVELKNVSHLITKAWIDDGVVYGEVEVLDTPAGKIVQSLVESNVTLGISSRGVGSTRKDGERQIVQDDFQLICWDIVAEPSTPSAFLFRESKQFTSVSRADLDRFYTRSDRVYRVFNDILAW